MKIKESYNDIQTRLMRVFREYSKVRRVTLNSQMCEFWEDPTVEIIVGSDELNAVETEFGVEFDDDSAMELYEMVISEAADYIQKMIQEQGTENHKSEDMIDQFTPEKTKLILRKIWQDNIKGRAYIIAAIDNIDFEEAARNKTKNDSN